MEEWKNEEEASHLENEEDGEEEGEEEGEDEQEAGVTREERKTVEFK